MRSIGQFELLGIDEGVESITEIYNEIAVMAGHRVAVSYAKAGRVVALPIDINLIAKHLGIKVIKEKLNLDGGACLNKKLAVTSAMGDKEVQIVVDSEVGYKTRRYAIANGIGRYLIHQSRNMFKNTYAIPLIPQSLEEIAADSIAVFLLMPIGAFKEEFLHYIEENQECPLDVDEWLAYLSEKCQITPFNLAIGYQQMKQVLCYQRREEFRKYDYDVTKMPEDKYDSIYA